MLVPVRQKEFFALCCPRRWYRLALSKWIWWPLDLVDSQILWKPTLNFLNYTVRKRTDKKIGDQYVVNIAFVRGTTTSRDSDLTG